MSRLFTDDHAWDGADFELSLELGDRSDERARAALERLWPHPTLTGCFLVRDREPSEQARHAPARRPNPLASTLYGVADIPAAGVACCRSGLTLDLEGRDWLCLGVPMGSLARVLPVGGWPFGDGMDLSWRDVMHAWLRDVAEWVHASVSIEVGLIAHDVHAEIGAARLGAAGVPAERWLGYLIPAESGLAWHPPTEGARYSF